MASAVAFTASIMAAGFSSDHSASAPVIFFLCFAGLRRLSGIVRSAGGMPRPRRARRRASLWTLMRSRLFFFMETTSNPITGSNENFRNAEPFWFLGREGVRITCARSELM